MLTADDVLRAQSRALIRVLVHYELYRAWNGAPTLLWRAIEAFGTESSAATDLETIHKDFYHVAMAASSIGLKHHSANAPLFLALHSFAEPSQEYRFVQPACWIAVTIAFLNKQRVPKPTLQGEVLERLEAAFDAEIRTETNAAVNS